MGRLSNIPLRTFREFLSEQGLEEEPSKGGHEKWTKPGLPRPIVIQSHIEPIPEFIIRSNLKTLGVSVADFLAFIKKN